MSTTELAQVQIRWMIRRDMPEVLAIEAASFDRPWDEADFLSHLKQRNCIGMVAEHQERIVGFMVYDVDSTSLRLLNFAVDPMQRRQGIGATMVAKLAAKLHPQRRETIRVYAREGNLGVQLFWRAMGFRAVDVIRGYYEDTGEDAYAMTYSLTDDDFAGLPKCSRSGGCR